MLSVVIPARNAAATLGTALDSVFRQTRPATEVLVIDDHSSDETAALASARGARVLRADRAGLVSALNLGLRTAREPWIARMDADDVCAPTRFERQLALVERCDVIGTQVRVVGGGEGFQHYARWQNDLTSHEAILRERFVESPFAHPSVIMRRDPVLRAGLYRDNEWPEDYELWLRLAERGCRFGKVPEILLDWTDHPQRTSRTDPRYRDQAFTGCKAHYLARGPAKQCRVMIWGAGAVGKRLGRALQREGIDLEFFVDIDEKKWGRVTRGVPVRSPDCLRPRPGRLLLAAVGLRGARALIRARAKTLGFVEGKNFFCAA
ncbi:MAG: glycosyltransferase [Myxococcota bacterium]